MNTAPVSPHALERAAPPSVPVPPAQKSFADLLAGNAAALAGFASQPAPSTDGSTGFGVPIASKLKKPDDGSDAAAAAAIPLPVPVQQQQSSNDPPSGDGVTPKPAATSDSTRQQGPASSQDSSASGSGTGAHANAAQAARTASVPSIGAEIGARVAVAAQGLVSQPSQALAALPHGATPPTASAPATPSTSSQPSATVHGTAAPDPAAIAPKSATAAAGAPTATAIPQEPQAQTLQNADALPGRASATDTTMPATSAADGADPGMPLAPGLATAPVAVAAAPGETPPASAIAASALEQVAAGIKQAAKGGLDRIEIQLKPPALGAIDVRLELAHDGRLSAVISADRSDTLMMLQRGSGDLQQALRDAGLQTDTGSLSFNLRGDSQANNHGNSQTGNGGTSSAGGSAGDAGPAPAAPAAASALRTGLLDIKV